MAWQKYKVSKRLIRKESIITFYTSKVIHFNCALVKEYLKKANEIIVYYDLENHLISFVPLKEEDKDLKLNKRSEGLKLSKKGNAKVINGCGIFKKIDLNLEKTLHFFPMRDPKTKWLVINYNHPIDEERLKEDN